MIVHILCSQHALLGANQKPTPKLLLNIRNSYVISLQIKVFALATKTISRFTLRQKKNLNNLKHLKLIVSIIVLHTYRR